MESQQNVVIDLLACPIEEIGKEYLIGNVRRIFSVRMLYVPFKNFETHVHPVEEGVPLPWLACPKSGFH